MNLKKKIREFCSLTRTGNGGFTLVELIVVIAILAILAGVAVPMYSGYIKKANEAADLQLLGALNTAFGAACVENGVAIDEDMEGAKFTMTGAEGEKTITGLVLPAAVEAKTRTTPTKSELVWASFQTYYGDNMEKPFKVFVEIVYFEGSFVGLSADEAGNVTITTSTGISVTISRDNKISFNNSAYGDMESETLLGKVDLVTQFAADMMGDEMDGNGQNYLKQLLNSQKYGMAFAKTLGYTEEQMATTEGQAAFVEEVRQLVREEAIRNGVDPEFVADDDFIGSEEYNAIYNQMVANNAVLYAAQNAASSSEGILDLLKGNNSKSTIAQNMLDPDKNDVGLSQAAIAYGLYTAYAERNNVDMTNMTPTDVMGHIGDQAFKDYLATDNAQADLDGFLAAMNMIDENSNSAIVTDVLFNGFNTDNLNELLNGAKG